MAAGNHRPAHPPLGYPPLARPPLARPPLARPPLIVPAHFAGPPGSGNGGYVAGRLAAYVPGGSAGTGTAVEVTLRHPPPLDAALVVVDRPPGNADGGVRATFGGALVAEARPATLADDPVDPVDYPTARSLADGYAGLRAHPFPGCVVCGTERAAPDGLGLRPGPVPDRPGTTAAAWVPDPAYADPSHPEVVPVELAWAALDCPGGWTLDLEGRPAVLGRMTAAVDALPVVGDHCVVMGRFLGREGRKSHTATTIYDGDGRVLGRARAVWIDVDPQRLGR